MLKNLKNPLLIFVITLLVFFLTRNPITKPLSLQMTLISLLVLGVYYVWNSRRSEAKTGPTSTFIYLLSVFLLFLIAATGWFFSPFFFLFYFLALGLAFMFDSLTSSVFVITLALLFSFNIGEVDLAYDFMVILSILAIIPVAIYLKKYYLKLKEAAKTILILEEQQRKYENSIDEVLANRMNNFSAVMRDPINNLKQLTYMMKQKPNAEQAAKYAEKMDISVEKALRLLKEFEQDTTGKKFISTEVKPRAAAGHVPAKSLV